MRRGSFRWRFFYRVRILFRLLIGRLPPEEKTVTWTGIVTIYAFFQGLVMPGMAIALNCALLKRSLLAWSLFAASCDSSHRRFGLRPS